MLSRRKGHEMHASLMTIVLMSIVIPASNKPFWDSENPHVSEIVRVTSPHSFECRLSNYRPAPAVRFRVYVLGVDMQNNNVSSKELLKERLKSCEHIELRNVRFKNYFRIKAELWLDGKQFGATHVQEAIEVERQLSKKQKESLLYRPVSSLPKLHKHPELLMKPARVVKSHSVTIGELLEREVDCSMLTDDMPLWEALELLCESVQPRLPLLIRWNDLQANAFIEKGTPIGVEGFAQLKLRYALSHILQAVTGREPKPVLIAEGGILILGSYEMLLEHKDTRVYDVRDLLALPSTGGLFQQGNQSNLGHIVGNFSR